MSDLNVIHRQLHAFYGFESNGKGKREFKAREM